MADSLVDISVPCLGNVRCNLRHCFKSAASNWCLRFWHTVLHSVCLCCCPYFGRNSRAVTPEFCYGVSQKATANFTQAGFTEYSSFQTSSQLSAIHNCFSGVFLGMECSKKLSDPENHVCLRQGVWYCCTGSYHSLGRQFGGESFGLRVFETRHKKRT